MPKRAKAGAHVARRTRPALPYPLVRGCRLRVAPVLVHRVVNQGKTVFLQHMRRGDRWLVYIPYQLGYDSATNGAIPAYSTLIFDLALLDFGSL